jgi:anti-sigma factor RsiW
MSTHVTDQLSAYIDDELSASARQMVDAHLRACAACAADLDALHRVVQFAGGVTSRDVAPSHDLWPGIHARIARVHQPRRVSFSIPQLAAAAVLLIAVSAGTAWVVSNRVAGPASTTSAAIEAEVEPTATPDVVRPVNFADPQYDAAVSDLERALDERRNDLNPRTVEILERNLKLIDAAIAQARQALEEDPGNAYLNRHLVESRRRKLELLRRAASINEAD